eukprot:4165015-Pyramimonas_sp.AAC.1
MQINTYLASLLAHGVVPEWGARWTHVALLPLVIENPKPRNIATIPQLSYVLSDASWTQRPSYHLRPLKKYDAVRNIDLSLTQPL